MRRGAGCLVRCPCTSVPAPLHSAPCKPLVRHLFGIDLEKIKKFDEQRKKRKWEKRDQIRQEIRALPIRQMQVLLSDKKPADIATPLHLTPAPLAPLFMPPSPACVAVTCDKQEVLLPQQLWGKITFLHLSFNQFAFDWGRKWCEAAMDFAALPLSTTPPTAPYAHSAISPLLPSSPALSTAPPSSPSASDPAAPSVPGSDPPPPAPPSPSLDSAPFDYYQISLIKNPFVRHWFGDYSLSSFRTATPQPSHRHLLSLLSSSAYAALTAQEPTLQLWRHELLGFVFLLDARGRIRWRAWGTMMDGDRDVLGRMVRELREEDRAERRREGERARGKEGMEQQQKRMASGIKGGQVYSASKLNGQQAGNGGVNGATNGVRAAPSTGSASVKGEKVERQAESVESERVEKAVNVGEATAIAKG